MAANIQRKPEVSFPWLTWEEPSQLSLRQAEDPDVPEYWPPGLVGPSQHSLGWLTVEEFLWPNKGWKKCSLQWGNESSTHQVPSCPFVYLFIGLRLSGLLDKTHYIEKQWRKQNHSDIYRGLHRLDRTPLLGLPQFLPALSPHHRQQAPKAALRLSGNVLQEPDPSVQICPLI